MSDAGGTPNMATFGIYTQYIFLNRLYPTILRQILRLYPTILRKKLKNLRKVNIFSKLSQLSLGFIRASPSSAKLKPAFPQFYTGEPVICPTKAILPLVLCGRVRHFLYIEIFILRKIFQVFLPSFTCISASESDKSAVYAQKPV